MSTEFIIGDSIVVCLTLTNPTFDPDNLAEESYFAGLSAQLQKICTPDKDSLILFEGGAYEPVYANNEDPTTGCSWAWAEKGGGIGQLILKLVDEPEFRVRVWVQLKVAKDDGEAWLTVDYNPTTLLVGNNIHPAFVKDFDTGEVHPYPSSDWGAMKRVFRLGFDFLEGIAGVTLFEGKAKQAIERGDVHLVRAQWATAKRVKDISQFLQLICVIYGQTIARGQGIISNANHLGLEFEPYPDLETHLVNGVKFRKLYGTKPLFSVSLYDKAASLEQKHQPLESLSVAEVKTVNGTVREDITAHSEGILLIVKAAQRKLRNLGPDDLKRFDFITPEVFANEEPNGTCQRQ